jgi:hypothetical protein
VIVVFALRSIVLSLYLLQLMEGATFRMLPFHPDKCGGLQPVGRLGLRNQYTLSILGVNVVLLLMTSRHLHWDRSLHDLIWAASIAYLILGQSVFIGPLLPFRAGMVRAKRPGSVKLSRPFRWSLSVFEPRFEPCKLLVIGGGDGSRVPRSISGLTWLTSTPSRHAATIRRH